MRVVLLKGCVQSVLRPEINEAAKRLLTRAGITVLDVKGESCCGALSHHLGEEGSALRFAKANIDAWTKEVEAGLDAVVITASGCGTMIKDYGYLLRSDPAHAAKAAHISGLAKDVSELLAEVGLPPVTRERSLAVAYHSACSLQHGQRINKQPRDLLRAAGFDISEIGEGHLCCGSAGIYSVLEPGIADELLARKAANIERTAAAVVATGNIGCITQLARRSALPVVHTVELLDWATGGPAPPELTAASAAPA
jgi:glycolate oxidase iron-sulfur subunit